MESCFIESIHFFFFYPSRHLFYIFYHFYDNLFSIILLNMYINYSTKIVSLISLSWSTCTRALMIGIWWIVRWVAMSLSKCMYTFVLKLRIVTAPSPFQPWQLEALYRAIRSNSLWPKILHSENCIGNWKCGKKKL